jgi:ankyrin repeat protein
MPPYNITSPVSPATSPPGNKYNHLLSSSATAVPSTLTPPASPVSKAANAATSTIRIPPTSQLFEIPSTPNDTVTLQALPTEIVEMILLHVGGDQLIQGCRKFWVVGNSLSNRAKLLLIDHGIISPSNAISNHPYYFGYGGGLSGGKYCPGDGGVANSHNGYDNNEEYDSDEENPNHACASSWEVKGATFGFSVGPTLERWKCMVADRRFKEDISLFLLCYTTSNIMVTEEYLQVMVEWAVINGSIKIIEMLYPAKPTTCVPLLKPAFNSSSSSSPSSLADATTTLNGDITQKNSTIPLHLPTYRLDQLKIPWIHRTLIQCIITNQHRLVSYLLNAGAEWDDPTAEPEAFAMACKHGCLETVKTFLHSLAQRPAIPRSSPVNPTASFFSGDPDDEIVGMLERGLSWAARMNHLSIVQLLTSKSTLDELLPSTPWTPSSASTPSQNMPSSSPGIVIPLSSSQIPTDILTPLTKFLPVHINSRRCSAFIWAAEHGNLQIVSHLIEHCGAEIHTQDDYALRWAASKGHVEIVRYLLENGADVNALDGFALRHAVRFAQVEVVKVIVEWSMTGSILKEENSIKNIKLLRGGEGSTVKSGVGTVGRQKVLLKGVQECREWADGVGDKELQLILSQLTL